MISSVVGPGTVHRRRHVYLTDERSIQQVVLEDQSGPTVTQSGVRVGVAWL